MTMRRALLFVLLTTLPLFAEPAEVLVGGTAFTRAPGRHEQPASASNGDQFFVAWTDRRSETQAIVGTRVTAEGRVLDPLGIRVSPLGQVADGPHVAWDGGAYLVVWSASPWGFVSPDFQSIYAARVDANGLLVMAPRAIAERGTAHAVASNGSVSVVVAGSRTIVLDRDANVLARETLPAIWLNQSGFTIGRAGSGFVAAWSANPGSFPRDNTIQAVALNADGRIAGGGVNIGNGTAPSVATDGTRVMIAWHRHTVQPGGFTLHTRPFDADLSNAGLAQTVDTGSSSVPPILIRRESRYELIAAYDTFLSPHASALQVRAIKLGPEGRMTGWFILGTLPPNVPGDVAAASNGVEMLLTTVARPWTGDLADVQARVVRGHEPEAPVLLSWSGNAQHNPSLATSPSGHIAAWTEDDGVYAARLDANGNSLDQRGVRLSTGAGRAHTAFDGTHYVVAWQHEDRIGVRWLSPLSGLAVAAAEVPLEEVPTDPAFTRVNLALAASPQATYVVTAQDRVRVTRIPHRTYRPDAAPLAVSPEGMQVERPDAAWNGSTLLVVWSEWHIPPRINPPFPVSIRIHAARVSAGLTLLDPASLVIADADELSAFGAPSVASNGADWLVVAPKNGYQIVARRVLQNGMPESTGPAWIAHGDLADVAWNGGRYVLAWSRAAENERLGRLYTAEVPARGTLVATRRTLVAADTAYGIPSVTAKSVAYTKYSFRPEHTGVARTFLRDHGAGQP